MLVWEQQMAPDIAVCTHVQSILLYWRSQTSIPEWHLFLLQHAWKSRKLDKEKKKRTKLKTERTEEGDKVFKGVVENKKSI